MTLEDKGANGDADRCKSEASAWFGELQEKIIAAGELLERESEGPFPEPGMAPGRFATKPWARSEGGGGRMALLKGRLFEKMAVHSSTVFGRFPAGFSAQIPGAEEDPRFWVSGVSLIAHPWNPNVPTVHMNTRFVVRQRRGLAAAPILHPCSIEGALTAISMRAISMPP